MASPDRKEPAPFNGQTETADPDIGRPDISVVRPAGGDGERILGIGIGTDGTASLVIATEQLGRIEISTSGKLKRLKPNHTNGNTTT